MENKEKLEKHWESGYQKQKSCIQNVTICSLSHDEHFLKISSKPVYFSSYFAESQTNRQADKYGQNNLLGGGNNPVAL